jgi:hypothetical protein
MFSLPLRTYVVLESLCIAECNTPSITILCCDFSYCHLLCSPCLTVLNLKICLIRATLTTKSSHPDEPLLHQPEREHNTCIAEEADLEAGATSYRNSLPACTILIQQYSTCGTLLLEQTISGEYTHANPIPRSIFEDCADKSSRLTKSPQAPRCRRERRLPLKAQTTLKLEKFAPTRSRTQDLMCYRGSCNHLL